MNSPKITRLATDKNPLSDVVPQAFSGYPREAQAILLAIRELIFAVSKSDPEIGQLQEALRWGELSFLTEKPNTGSIIRLAITKAGEPAVFFHCGTSLVETFRAQCSHIFDFENNRAMVLRLPVEETAVELSDCIRQALRYKLDRRSEKVLFQFPIMSKC